MLDNRIIKKILERSVGGKSLLESRGIDGKLKCGWMPPYFSI
jgi:hypothetical protein